MSAGEVSMSIPRIVSILVFDDVEILDFAGPYEVFNLAGELSKPPAFHVHSVGLAARPVTARGKLVVTPHYSMDDCPQADILLVPGGYGTRPLLRHGKLLQWLADQAARVELLLSVCTGALLLAKAGLLEDRKATTHHDAFDLLAEISPTSTVVRDQRFVQASDRIFTAGGISAGIDLALFMVEKITGGELARAVAAEMEYPRR
jgi:transcriptional regulator GlxA family with amidase domain